MIRKSISTFVLIGLNLIAFVWLAVQQQSLLMNTQYDVLAILHAGGNLNPITLGGEPWRIITSMFLHFGVLHFLVNMYALFTLGITLEPVIGTPRFLLIYFFCGIAAGLASLVFNFFIISAGASGALFGLFGYRLGAELIGNFHDRKKLMVVVANFVLFLVVNAVISSQFNVDMAGHIGGCIAGLLLSVLHFRFRILISNKYLVIALVGLSLTVFALPKDQLNYYRIFQRVLKAEKRTNQFYQYVHDDGELLDSLETMLPVWDSIRYSLRSLDKIHEALINDTATLGRYTNLRKQDAAYRINLIERESYVYFDSIELVSMRLDSLPDFEHILNFDIPEASDVHPDTAAATTPALEPKRLFYDVNWKETDDPSLSAYYRIGTVDSLGRWQGQVRDYYRNGTVQMKGKYKDDLKDGVFLYYSERGTYSSAGKFVKEESVGKWEEYHWNGTLESEVRYGPGAFTLNVWDSLGRAQVVNGNGRAITWHANGQVAEEGSYREGRREGDWLGFHENGRPYYKEYYNDNRLVRGVSEDKDGKRYVYDQLSLYPFPEPGMTEFKKYVEKNRRSVPGSSFLSGSVKVIFDVGTDGSMWDFIILQGLSAPHDEEAIRLVREGPRWRPGLLHGHVKFHSQGFAEIEF